VSGDGGLWTNDGIGNLENELLVEIVVEGSASRARERRHPMCMVHAHRGEVGDRRMACVGALLIKQLMTVAK
jgi:hypothetical protein